MKRRVICISHTDGAGGPDVGRAVAKELGLRYVDDEIVVQAAEKEGLDLDEVVEVEKRRGFLARLLEPTEPPLPQIPALALSDVGFTALGTTIPNTREGYRELIRQVIHETARQGNVVMVAHAASLALGDDPNVLRVMLTASEATRAQRLGEARRISIYEAETAVREADKNRADYLLGFYRIREELPTHYDVVINTDTIGPEAALRIIIAAAR